MNSIGVTGFVGGTSNLTTAKVGIFSKIVNFDTFNFTICIDNTKLEIVNFDNLLESGNLNDVLTNVRQAPLGLACDTSNLNNIQILYYIIKIK